MYICFDGHGFFTALAGRTWKSWGLNGQRTSPSRRSPSAEGRVGSLRCQASHTCTGGRSGWYSSIHTCRHIHHEQEVRVGSCTEKSLRSQGAHTGVCQGILRCAVCHHRTTSLSQIPEVSMFAAATADQKKQTVVQGQGCFRPAVNSGDGHRRRAHDSALALVTT